MQAVRFRDSYDQFCTDAFAFREQTKPSEMYFLGDVGGIVINIVGVAEQLQEINVCIADDPHLSCDVFINQISWFGERR